MSDKTLEIMYRMIPPDRLENSKYVSSSEVIIASDEWNLSEIHAYINVFGHLYEVSYKPDVSKYMGKIL